MDSTQLLLEDISGILSLGQNQGGKKLSVDRDKGVIKGIKIIGFNSQNGRRYLPEALKDAAPLYEGIKVNIDHPESGPAQQRSSHDRFGKFVNVRFVQGEGIYGDLLYLKNHPLAESVCEAAEREEMNDVFGMSHNAQGEGTVDKKGIFIVSKITEVRHVDLVADPATTKSLTESQQADQQETEEAAGNRVRYKSKRQTPGAKRGYVKAKSKSAKKPTGTLKEDTLGDPPRVEVEKDKKDLHYKLMLILTKHDIADEKKADEILQFISKEYEGTSMDSKESIDEKEVAAGSEVLVEKKDEPAEKDESGDEKMEGTAAKSMMCEKCGAKMEAKSEDSEDEGEEDEDEGEHEDEEQDKKLVKKMAKESVDPNEQLKFYKTKDRIRDLCESYGVKFEDSLVEDLSGLGQESLERQLKRIAAAYSAAKPKCSPTQATFQESKDSGKKIPEGESLFRWLVN